DEGGGVEAAHHRFEGALVAVPEVAGEGPAALSRAEQSEMRDEFGAADEDGDADGVLDMLEEVAAGSLGVLGARACQQREAGDALGIEVCHPEADGAPAGPADDVDAVDLEGVEQGEQRPGLRHACVAWRLAAGAAEAGEVGRDDGPSACGKLGGKLLETGTVAG